MHEHSSFFEIILIVSVATVRSRTDIGKLHWKIINVEMVAYGVDHLVVEVVFVSFSCDAGAKKANVVRVPKSI